MNAAAVEEFTRVHGRRPRVLHIGNIANNAYLNARMLNDAGFDCDVICYDYYHIMGCPEWEDADFEGAIEDHFAPDWTAVDLKGFERPAWFAQGDLGSCVQYLCGRRARHGRVPALPDGARRTPPAIVARAGRVAFRWSARLLRAPARLAELVGLAPAYRALHARVQATPAAGPASRLGRAPMVATYRALAAGRWMHKKARGAVIRGVTAWTDWRTGTTFESRVQPVRDAFRAAFPDRADQLEVADLIPLASALPLWSMLLTQYDAVIGYATDGIYPLACGVRPYLAYEHGTIRHVPFEPTPQGRLCAATYRLADAALITNCDNIDAAQRLGLDNHRFIPHPVNEAHVGGDAHVALRADLRARLDCAFIIFHPARQHWEERRHPDWEKGNDVLIRGLAAFVAEHGPVVGAVFVDWGKTVDASRALLDELGIADRVHWIAPQPNQKMITYIQASEVVADQFFLGAFGSLTPKALLHGCPVMLHLDEARHHWCFPEMPPVVNVNTPEGVAAALARLYHDRPYHGHLAAEGRAWYDRYHSNAVIVETLGDAIMDSIATYDSRGARAADPGAAMT